MNSLDVERLLGSVISGALGGKKKKHRGVARYLTGGQSSFLNASTLLALGGLAWGVYETMTQHFTDTLLALGKAQWTCDYMTLRTRVDYLLISPDWHATTGGIADSDSSDHRPIWIEVRQSKR